MTDLIEAIINQNTQAVRKLLEQGCDPNVCDDPAGITPLHYAAQIGNLEIATILVVAGANTFALSCDGYAPLDIAKMHKQPHIQKLLQQCTPNSA